MKELEKSSLATEALTKIEQQVKKSKMKGQVTLMPGHSIWELEISSRLIRRAKVEETVATIGEHGTGLSHKVIEREGCLYFSALNARAADKQGVRLLMECGAISHSAGKRLLQVIKKR
jgi:hypothetical protein